MSSGTGRVVLLNGPPSSGKTSLAQSFVAQSLHPWFHRNLDDFRRGYADRYWRDDDGRLFAAVAEGYLGALRSLALAGVDLIAETVITPERVDAYAAAFDDIRLLLVAVRCPIEVARRREAARADRLRGPIDLPDAGFESVYTAVRYDLQLDSREPLESVVRTLAERATAPFDLGLSRLRPSSSAW